MLLAAFMPLALELCSECLKICSPNMKKKKDAVFDELKSNIMKPLKDLSTLFKDYFASRGTIWAPQDFAALNESFFSHPKILTYIKEKRL